MDLFLGDDLHVKVHNKNVWSPLVPEHESFLCVKMQPVGWKGVYVVLMKMEKMESFSRASTLNIFQCRKTIFALSVTILSIFFNVLKVACKFVG